MDKFHESYPYPTEIDHVSKRLEYSDSIDHIKANRRLAAKSDGINEVSRLYHGAMNATKQESYKEFRESSDVLQQSLNILHA